MGKTSNLDAGRNLPTQFDSAIRLAAERIVQRCDLLATISEDPVVLTRTFCSPAMKRAHSQLSQWFELAKLESVLDPVGNLVGRPKNVDADENKSVFLIGSHIDTVRNAGRFDGALGILLGLGVVETLMAMGAELDFDIHVVAFSEEEGVRYKMPFIGSRGIAGTFEKTDFARVDDQGIAMRESLRQFDCDPDQWKQASYAEKNLIGFLEAHLEQAVLLEEQDLPVGVVSAIAGQTRATIVLTGISGHAGTVPHDQRRDALAAAAELILKIERLGQETKGLFATIGNVIAAPGLSNVISGQSELWLDLRHEIDDHRLVAFGKINQLTEQVCRARNVTSSITSVQHSPAVPMDPALSSQLGAAIKEIELTPMSLVSGAGHDAMIMSTIAPSCMLFVRCRDGISHHPDEFVSSEDIAIALNVMVRALMKVSA